MVSSDLNIFFRLWTFSTSADLTGGQVNYLSRVDAQEEGLAYVQPDGSAVLRVDDWTDLPFGAPRNSCVVPAKVRGGPRASNAITSTNYSVRISSMKPFDYGLVVADFAFMPFGCSVWPAFWASGPNWPDNGEIDIVEGVNLKSSLVDFLGSPFIFILCPMSGIDLLSTPARIRSAVFQAKHLLSAVIQLSRLTY